MIPAVTEWSTPQPIRLLHLAASHRTMMPRGQAPSWPARDGGVRTRASPPACAAAIGPPRPPWTRSLGGMWGARRRTRSRCIVASLHTPQPGCIEFHCILLHVVALHFIALHGLQRCNDQRLGPSAHITRFSKERPENGARPVFRSVIRSDFPTQTSAWITSAAATGESPCRCRWKGRSGHRGRR